MIYRFRITTGKKDGFHREYHFHLESSLYEFNRFIQNDLDFDTSQISAFLCIDNKGVQKQYALFDTGDGSMDSIVLRDIVEKHDNTFYYLFDFFNNRSLIIEILGEAEVLPRKSYPRIEDSKGDAPGQFEDRPVHEPLPEVKSSGIEDEEDFEEEDE